MLDQAIGLDLRQVEAIVEAHTKTLTEVAQSYTEDLGYAACVFAAYSPE